MAKLCHQKFCQNSPVGGDGTPPPINRASRQIFRVIWRFFLEITGIFGFNYEELDLA